MSTLGKPHSPEIKTWEAQITELIELNEQARCMIGNLSHRLPPDTMGFFIEQRMALLVEGLFYSDHDEEGDDEKYLALYKSPEFVEMCNRIDERLPEIARKKPSNVPDDISHVIEEMEELLADVEDAFDKLGIPEDERVSVGQRARIELILSFIRESFTSALELEDPLN